MHSLADDLDQVLAQTAGLWEEMRGGRLFITGGTGFFGHWLLESLLWANDKLRLGAKVVVLTRNPAAFKEKSPHLAANPALQLLAGDQAGFDLPAGSFTHFIHAAGELSTANPTDAAGAIERAFLGLRRVLELASRQRGAKLLYTSSGAVYGPAVAGRQKVREDDAPSCIPLAPRGAYAEAKRAGELFGTLFAQQHGLEFKVARGFAFLGPYLPLDGPLAAGNFIRDVLSRRSLTIRSAGTAVRSYLYGADLAVWLWTILFRGANGRPYNVGSDQPLTIAGLARAIAGACEPRCEVRILGEAKPGEVVDYYVPDISRAAQELGLKVQVPLPDAIGRTLRWHRAA